LLILTKQLSDWICEGTTHFTYDPEVAMAAGEITVQFVPASYEISILITT